MTGVELSPEQYGSVARALVYIAAGRGFRPDGRPFRVSRAEMITRAREACSAISLNFLGDGTGRSSFPQEIGLDHDPTRLRAHGG